MYQPHGKSGISTDGNRDFANAEEMKAVVGMVEGNSFVKQTREETKAFKKRIQAVRRRT